MVAIGRFMMKKYVLALILTVALMAAPGFAAAEKIVVQREAVSQINKQENSAMSAAGKDNRLSSKRIKEKTEITNARVKNASGHNMIRYQTFKDGEGAAKMR